ncbi:MAG: hypothetical protein R3185_03315, partial [Candidatus Thermoplasmatota archaeon]|nr:hypothetical protein [Candidatus Thermoplasmatota archaeon]
EMGRWPLVAYSSGKITVSEDRLAEVLEDILQDVLDPVDATVVGSDEAGKGEWLGPLVAAACAVPSPRRAGLVARGVMDSKDLSDTQLTRVAKMLEDSELPQAVVLIAPERFNELWPAFKAEGKNLNDLLAWAHAKALGQVLQELEEADRAAEVRIVVDQFDKVATEARTQAVFDTETYNVEQRVRAEDEVAVAAASVLARAARERWIDAYERQEGVPVRSLNQEDAAAREDAGAFAKVGYL